MTTQVAGETPSSVTATAMLRASTTSAMIPLVGSKMRKQLMTGRLQEHVSAPTSDFAVRQLEKMGWTAGTGLGKKRDGMVSHIKVKKRAENAGLGTERQAAEQQQTAESWWKDSLGDTLARLSSAKTGKKKRKKEFTDEELFEATGGARFGTKGGKLRAAKWRRTESSSSSKSLDENKAESPDDVADKQHTAIPADKLFNEETLNEGPAALEVSSDSSSIVKKKKSKKDKKEKKRSKKDKKEKSN